MRTMSYVQRNEKTNIYSLLDHVVILSVKLYTMMSFSDTYYFQCRTIQSDGSIELKICRETKFKSDERPVLGVD